jgi:hypothetical protein
MTKMFWIVIAVIAILGAACIGYSIISDCIRYTRNFIRKLKVPEKNPFSAVIKDTHHLESPKIGQRNAVL